MQVTINNTIHVIAIAVVRDRILYVGQKVSLIVYGIDSSRGVRVAGGTYKKGILLLIISSYGLSA